MSPSISPIDPTIADGLYTHSNPDIRNLRSTSAHIRHFDQSQSFDGFEHRPVGFSFINY